MILTVGLTPTLQRTMIFDQVVIDQVNRARQVHDTASGKAVNVARVAHTLGERVMAVGVAGGPRGKLLLDGLTDEKIAHDFLEVAAPTRLCTTVVDQKGATQTELVEESSPILAEDCQKVLEKVRAHLGDARVMTLSGSLTPGAPLDFYERCVALANAFDVPTIIDARDQPLTNALTRNPLVVKLNRAELAATLGLANIEDASLEDALRRLCEMGPKWGAVTLGAGGVVFTNGKKFWQIAPPNIRLVNAIGSGDSFTAGLAVGMVRKLEMPQAMRLAIAAAAANAQTLTPGLVVAGEVERLLGQVHALQA